MDVHTAMNVAGSAPVTVEGVLLVGADSRLVADHADPPGAAILLPHEATEHCLLSRVPAYGGGPHIYHERAVVTGRIVEAPWRFATVDELTVIREGETYHFESVFPLHR